MSPVAQVNTINASNETPLIPQRPTSDEDDLADEVAIQELTAKQILRKARDHLQTKEKQNKNTSELQSKTGKRQRDAYEKEQVIASMINEYFQETEEKKTRIRAMSQLHTTEIASKDRELRNIANKMIAHRNKSNIVSVFISGCLYNFST